MIFDTVLDIVKDFNDRWAGLPKMTPKQRRVILEAMSSAEIDYYIAPDLRTIMTREEKIEEHLSDIALQNGEPQDSVAITPVQPKDLPNIIISPTKDKNNDKA